MTNEKLLEELNKIANITDRLITKVINESKGTGKSKSKSAAARTTEVNVSEETKAIVHDSLIKNSFPVDSEFMEDIGKIVAANSISADDLTKCLERVKAANDKEPKNDIKKYIYSCLYKINRA